MFSKFRAVLVALHVCTYALMIVQLRAVKRSTVVHVTRLPSNIDRCVLKTLIILKHTHPYQLTVFKVIGRNAHRGNRRRNDKLGERRAWRGALTGIFPLASVLIKKRKSL